VYRVVKPGGCVVVSDMLPHESDWMRERMGDLRLGLKPDQIVSSLARAGFRDLVSQSLTDRYCVTAPDGARTEFSMFVVRGCKP
jgi:ArsR family transcriptional regulator